jgi:3-isopropylmalate/(R)-2-methylmalate dehydratase small subunit
MPTMKTSVTGITGTALPLRGDDIDTDRIIPARYLRCVTFDGLGAHAFEDDRKQDANHPFNAPQYAGATILVVGRNFGCGSSREHAPQALNRWGIAGIIGQSFAEIFFGNCLAMGIPCITADATTCEAVMAAVEATPTANVAMDVATETVSVGDVSHAASIPQGPRQALLDGTWNATALLLANADAIAGVAAELPYVSGFAEA